MANQQGNQALAQTLNQTNSIMNSGQNPMEILKQQGVPISHIQKIQGFLNTPIIGNMLYSAAEKKGYSREQINQVFSTLTGQGGATPQQPINVPTTSTTQGGSDMDKYRKYASKF